MYSLTGDSVTCVSGTLSPALVELYLGLYLKRAAAIECFALEMDFTTDFV